jgi:hypothetical protein
VANENILRVSWLDGSRRLRSYPQASCDYSSQPVSFVLVVDLFFWEPYENQKFACEVSLQGTGENVLVVWLCFPGVPPRILFPGKKEAHIGQVDHSRLRFLEERSENQGIEKVPQWQGLGARFRQGEALSEIPLPE